MSPHDLQSRPHVLVADDQVDVLEALRLLLKAHGYDIDTAASPAAVLSALEKRWDNSRLMTILGTQVELGRALRRARRLESENRILRRDNLPRLIADSPKMKPILQLMERVGPSDANVLITGEHGTGKELVAQWLHASSARAQT